VALPDPVEPEWLTESNLDQVLQAGAGALNDLDYFVLSSATATEDTRPDILAESVRLVKSNLHKLFYPVSFDKLLHPAQDAEFYATLASFERRAGLNVDGKLSVSEAKRLAFLANLQFEPDIATARRKIVHGSNSLAGAEGTWTLQGEDIAHPVNRSQVQCWRAFAMCTVFTANIELPSAESTGLAGLILTTEIDNYDVVEWRVNELRARAVGLCRESVLTVNWSTEQVYQIVTDVSGDGCPGAGFEPLRAPRIATLESGDAIQEYLRARKEVLAAVSNAPVR
jgi:hypothetical protein